MPTSCLSNDQNHFSIIATISRSFFEKWDTLIFQTVEAKSIVGAPVETPSSRTRTEENLAEQHFRSHRSFPHNPGERHFPHSRGLSFNRKPDR
jgi:hypothetical protein